MFPYKKYLGYLGLNILYLELIGLLPPRPNTKWYKLRLVFHYVYNPILIICAISAGLNAAREHDNIENYSLGLYFFICVSHSYTFVIFINYHYDILIGKIAPDVERYFKNYSDLESHKKWIIKHTKLLQRYLYINRIIYFLTTLVIYLKELDWQKEERPLVLPVDFLIRYDIPLFTYYILFVTSILVLENMTNFYNGIFTFNFAILM